MTEKTFDTLSNVKTLRVRWFWEPYIPIGMLTILEGDPGIGKSYLAMHFAAIKSVGGVLPGGQKVSCGSVLYLTTEDDPAYTLRPRIEAMGGDVSKIRFMRDFLTFDDEGIARLAQELDAEAHDLVVVDSLFGFVPAGTDTFKPVDIRALLTSIGRVAREHDTAIVLIRHWTKGERGKAIYRGSGSIDIMAVVRAALTVAIHPDESNLRVVAHSKHNLSERGISQLFEIVPSKLKERRPTLKWRGTTELTADQLEASHPEPKAGDVAVKFLEAELKDGPKLAKEIVAEAKKENIAERTLDRAKRILRVKTSKIKEGWIWSLPTPRAPER